MNKLPEIIERLEHYNKWRRGEIDPTLRGPDPQQLGKDIDAAIEVMKLHVSTNRAN